MKGLAVGDLLLPTSKMVNLFSVEGVRELVPEVHTTEFVKIGRAHV